MLEAESHWLLPTLTAIAGLFLGGFGKILFERYKFLQKRAILTNMLSGEIKAIQEQLRQEPKLTKSLRDCASKSARLFMPNGKNRKLIYEKCMEDLGYLPRELAEKIVYFYKIFSQIAADIDHYCDRDTAHIEISPSDIGNIYYTCANKIDNLINLADEISLVATRFYNKRFLFVLKIT